MTDLPHPSHAVFGPDGVPESYGDLRLAYDALVSGVVAIDRSDLHIVDLVGADIRRFANGMFTANFRDLAVHQVVESGWCDDRGRLLGLMRAMFVGEKRLRIVLEGTAADAFVEHFDRYVFADDVDFEDHSSDCVVLSLYGAGLNSLIAQVPEITPDNCWEVCRSPSHSADLVLEHGVATVWWERLLALGVVPAGTDLAEVQRVEAGLARWPVDMSPKQLPHEVALRDRILTFDKGCYVGQETINRLDVRGSARKALAGVHGPSELQVGDALHIDGSVAGVVGSVVTSPVLGRVGLAVVRKPYDAGADATLAGGAPVRVVPLPFAKGPDATQ